ncbi:hypothetical protein [Micromonospora sp. C28ISP2-4]|uniref:hypothetical protein n=1 Tax=Micromonospora sp. C28ISP2-4 TaxID=3059523 RepID=UPI0026756351|nr:hypothetical protein [Micromonospora sp. C28ISP2-4]MDO3686457.1 hypothetical protein [Micromonospora sp. C28ISP2-4]
MNADDFSSIASMEQAAFFGAACAERAGGVLFWAASGDDRREDLDRYHEALEMLWSPVLDDPSRCSSMWQGLEGMREMRVGAELSGPAAHALHSVVVVHSALRMLVEGPASAMGERSMAARNSAFRIEARTGRRLLGVEERCQAEGIGGLIAGEGVDAIRDRARRHGRERMELLYAHLCR